MCPRRQKPSLALRDSIQCRLWLQLGDLYPGYIPRRWAGFLNLLTSSDINCLAFLDYASDIPSEGRFDVNCHELGILNFLVGEMTPILQDVIEWRLYPMHGFFCACSFHFWVRSCYSKLLFACLI